MHHHTARKSIYVGGPLRGVIDVNHDFVVFADKESAITSEGRSRQALHRDCVARGNRSDDGEIIAKWHMVRRAIR